MDHDTLKAMLAAHPHSYDLGVLGPFKKHLADATANAQAAGDDDAADMIGTLHAVIDALETEQIRRLDAFAAEAMIDFEKCVKAKRDVELRWIDDLLQYEGQRKLRDSKAYPNDAGDKWSSDNEKPAVRATRSRTLRYAGRLVDMMLPGNDIPIKVKPTPKPDPQCFPGLMQQPPGSPPLQPEDVLNYAADAAARMQACVKDQLLEQKFSDIGRRKIFDGAQRGTGISKGPFMDYRRRRVPRGAKSEIVLDQTPVPGYSYINPWFFYYDMSPTLNECSECYEVHLMDRRQLNDMKRYPNVVKANIKKLLAEEDPKLPTELNTAITTRNRMLDEKEPIKGRWGVIERHGVIDPDELKEATGIEWTDENSLPLIEFWFCDGKVVRWKLSPMECDWRVPYYNFTPFPCDDTIWGYGVPRMANGGQRIVDGALDATLANASIASGPFIAFKKGEVSPMDEEWRLRGPKALSVQTDGPIQDAIYSFTIPSNVEGNLGLLQKGLDFIDDDILLDQISGTDMSSEEMPASGLLQQINIKSVFQRMIAARADDSWFKELGERFGQWNLQFSKDESIKGDFDYEGIASTTLVSKDLQIQHLQVGMQMSSQPQYAGMVDHYEELSSFYRMLDVPNRDSIVFDKATAQKNQQAASQQQPDPMVALKTQELQQKGQEMQQKLAAMQGDAQLKAQEVMFAHQERMAEIARQTAKDQLDAKAAEQDNYTRVLVAQSQKETALIGFAAQSKQNIRQVAAVIQKAAMDAETKKFMASMKLGEVAHHENQENARTVLKSGVATAHKVIDTRKEHLHKAVDVQMQQKQQKHEADQAQKAQDAAAAQPEPEEGEDES